MIHYFSTLVHHVLKLMNFHRHVPIAMSTITPATQTPGASLEDVFTQIAVSPTLQSFSHAKEVHILYSTYYDNRFRVVSCHMSMYMISICMHRVVQECILLCFFLELFRNAYCCVY